MSQIKKDQISARISKNKIKTSLLTTLLGELETDSKSKNGGEIGDEKILAKIKKFEKGINEMMTFTPANSDRYSDLKYELSILSTYIPSQLSVDELTAIISTLLIENKNIGHVMSRLKADYAGRVDGKLASQIAKNLIS